MSVKLALAPWVAFGGANAICCSLVVAATQVSWQLGFSLTAAYCMASLGLAVNLESQRWQHGLRSWLWILVCCQVGCVGTWLSMNVIAPWNFSMEVRAHDSLDTLGLGHIVHGQHLYFSQTNASGRILMRANHGSVDYVPPGVMDAHSFIEHNGDLFFIGRVLEGGAGECLWGMRGDGGDAILLQAFQPGFQLRHLRRNESLGAVFFQAVGLCGWFRSITEFRSNGTVEGTEPNSEGIEGTGGDFPGLVDLCLKLASGMEWRPPTGRLLSILLLGILPQTGLATYLLIWKKVPGVFLNVFVGAYAATFILWILMKGMAVNLLLFLQASTMTYATTACVAVALNQVLWSNVSRNASFVEELGTWASSISCISFFGAVHLALNIPSSEGWAWPLYGILILPQIAFALLMRRTTPMALFIAGALVLLYKAILETLNPRIGFPADLSRALQLGVFYAIGGIVLLFLLVYHDNKTFLEAVVHRHLRRSHVPVEAESDELVVSAPVLEPDEEEESWLILQQLPWQQLLQLHRHLSSAPEMEKAEDEEDC